MSQVSTWYDAAASAIRSATKDLPEDTPLDERIKVVDDAYPFGIREHFPYKKWLQARRHYLVRFGYKPKGSQAELPMLSPLDRARLRAQQTKPAP